MKGPVIIVGSVRTGSSILNAGLRELGYQGHEEGHLFRLFYLLKQTVDRYYSDNSHLRFPGSLFNAVSIENMHELIAEGARKLVAAHYNSNFWVEKTVNEASLRSLKAIFSIWPQAVGFFTVRRPLEVLRSRLLKFPKVGFASHVMDIKCLHRYWLSVRSDYPNVIEIEHFRLIEDSNRLVDEISRHLNLEEPQKQKLLLFLRNNFIERSSGTYSPVEIEELNLSKENKDLLLKELGFIFDAYNYSLNRSYFR